MTPTAANRSLRRALAWLKFTLAVGRIGRFLGYAAQRFLADGGPRQAAGLSYVSLLAIVPLLAVGMAVLAGFPAFESLRLDIQAAILSNFLPDAGIEISEQLQRFVDNASRMTAPGLIGLAVTALLLLSNINSALNAIWRVTEPRPIALRFAVYWVILTLGPILIGASISISSYAFAAAEWFDLEGMSRGLVETSRLLSLTFGALGFSLLYFVVPNRAVGIGHALAGGVVAALLFDLLKSGFGLYLRHIPSYQLVYGALSTLPIFLVWMYLSWAVALFGAEVAAALPEWRATRARGSRAAGPGAHLALALSLLARLRAASIDGARPRERRLARGLPATPAEVDTVLKRLRRARFVDRTLGGRWVLSRDLRHARLRELVAVLELDPGPGAGWPPQAQNAVAGLAARLADSLDRPIEALLDEAGGGAAAEPGRHDPAKS